MAGIQQARLHQWMCHKTRRILTHVMRKSNWSRSVQYIYTEGDKKKEEFSVNRLGGFIPDYTIHA